MKSNCHADARIALIMAITNTATNETKYWDVMAGTYDKRKYSYSAYHSAYIYGNNAYYMPASELLKLSAGTYELRAMTCNRYDGEYLPVLIPSGGSRYITAVSEGGSVTLTPEEGSSASLSVNNVTFASKLYAGQEFMVAVEMQSKNGEYLNNISLNIVKGTGRFATLVYQSDPVYLAISTSKPYTYVFSGTIPEGLTGDDFKLQILNGNNIAVYNEIVSIKAAPTEATTLSMENCSLNGVLNVNNVNFTADVKCSQGFFGGKITPYAYQAATDKYVQLTDANTFVIEAGTTYTVQFFADSANLPLGNEYQLRLVARPTTGDNIIISGPSFKTSDVSGIEDLKADEIEHTGVVSVYDVQGRKLYSADAESFDIDNVEAKGILIIRSAAGVQKVVK